MNGSLSGGTCTVFLRLWLHAWDRTYNLIKLENARFASIFVLKFLVRHKLAIAVQQVLHKQSVVVKPFSDEYELPSD